MSALGIRSLKAIARCKACSLHRNQCPLVEARSTAKADVFWVGLSAKPGPQTRPLSEDTRSGAIIAEVETMFPTLGFYRTNLVKCPPMRDQRLRYPTAKEMTSCSQHIVVELKVTKPKLVILLGKQVIDFVMQMAGAEAPEFQDDFAYPACITDMIAAPLICAHHPSFVNVYRRKRLPEYTRGIAHAIATTCDVKPVCLN